MGLTGGSGTRRVKATLTLVALAAVALAVPTASAQQPRLNDVVTRLGDYIVRYETQLATVVAEETYRQVLEEYGAASALARPGGVTPPPLRTRRTLRSDYALTRPADRDAWVGFRDTFEVDGTAVRDRDERLQQLVTSGAIGQAARIAGENARFNLAGDILTRNINVPTFALELLHPRNRQRFSFSRRSDDSVNGRKGWTIEFRERDRPTIVRTPAGKDNRTRGFVVVDPASGEVLRTTLTWEDVVGTVAVSYDRVDGIDVLVPMTMTERFQRGSAVISGEASYSNYRRFQTGGRLISP